MKNEKFKSLKNKTNDVCQTRRTRGMFKDKKGVNDISIIAVFIFIFFGTAVIIPFINSEFGVGASNLDTDAVTGEVKEGASSVTAISAFGILTTVLKLAFFDFGNTLGLPFWLDAVYTVIGLLFILVIARNIWVGGGG